MTWTTAQAIELCRRVEAVCPPFGCHVALTGGTLYKDGERKDVDLLFYKIRQTANIQMGALLWALCEIGFEMGKQHDWVQKATYEGKAVDLFFPEDFPARDLAPGDYGL